MRTLWFRQSASSRNEGGLWFRKPVRNQPLDFAQLLLRDLFVFQQVGDQFPGAAIKNPLDQIAGCALANLVSRDCRFGGLHVTGAATTGINGGQFAGKIAGAKVVDSGTNPGPACSTDNGTKLSGNFANGLADAVTDPSTWADEDVPMDDCDQGQRVLRKWRWNLLD